jgi:hypothetical protein
MCEQITAGLQDPSRKVRIAAAEFLAQKFDNDRSQVQRKMQQQSSGNSEGEVSVLAATPISPPSTLTTVIQFFSGAVPAIAPSATPPPVSLPPTITPEGIVSKPQSPQPAKDQKEDAKDGKKDDKTDAEPPEPSWDLWLKEFYAGKHREKWTSDLVGPLQKMFQAKDAEERWAAVSLLVPLGKAPPLTPLLEETVRDNPQMYYHGVQLLPWLLWDERLKLFRELQRLAPKSESQTSLLVRGMSEAPDRRLIEIFWRMLADPKLTVEDASSLQYGILGVYDVDRWSSSSSSENERKKKQQYKRLARETEARMAAGTEMQRLVALCLLTFFDPELAGEKAKQFQADAAASQALRDDAFQISLSITPEKAAIQNALAAISGNEMTRKKLSLEMLVRGQSSLRQIREHLTIRDTSNTRGRTSGTPIVPEPPKGLTAAHVEPLLNDSDPVVAAQAGYLLALLGEPRGLDPLLRQLRQAEKDKTEWRTLAYRAIAALDDSSHLPLLREIYAALSEYEKSEFYWTIRIMTGPEMLEFRKQIREEVGMSNLR